MRWLGDLKSQWIPGRVVALTRLIPAIASTVKTSQWIPGRVVALTAAIMTVQTTHDASQWIPGRVVALTPHLEVVMWMGFGRPYWRTSAFLVEIAVKFGWVRRMASFADEYRGRRDRGVGLRKNHPL